ncbi:MAG TPA: nucleoside transporter C-terminal domain-containing protein [bacterium]|nr:nucleoside transporter C-terminal domain-containing protein [bacterium]
MEIYNLISFGGLFGLLFFAWLISADRTRMNWRVVIWGVLLQLLFGAVVFMIPAGTKVFLFLNHAVIRVMDSASAGARFVFGKLALPPGTTNEWGEQSLGFFLAFQGFPTIVFFSALMSILYYWNILPAIIRGFAYVFTKLMRVSGAESLCTAANIFAGVESSLTIRPYLNRMTRSELCTILTAGMATVSSNVMAVYVFSLKDYFPQIAGHLISASILAAPASLVMSKLVLPETESPETLGEHIRIDYQKESNIFEAVINGAQAGVQLIVGIVSLLLAVMGLVALVDLVLGWCGTRINILSGLHMHWALKDLLGYIFYPFTILIGVPVSDAGVVSRIIGERAILTEVTSYQDLAMALKGNLLAHPRSAVIATYALCGFAHVASMAIFVGGTAAIAPAKMKELSQVGFRALIAATLACMMTACVAGTFFTNASILLGR